MLMQRSVSITELPTRAPLNARSKRMNLHHPVCLQGLRVLPLALQNRAHYCPYRTTVSRFIKFVHYYEISSPKKSLCSQRHTHVGCVLDYMESCSGLATFWFIFLRDNMTKLDRRLESSSEQTEKMSYPKKTRYPGTMITIKLPS